MSLDWQHIDQWEAGEIALLAFIAALLLLLIVLLVCIVHYGRIYHELKRLEPKALYQYDIDGPTYNTKRPEYHVHGADSSDEDEDDPMSGVNNVNISNKEIRRSLGAAPLARHRRYNTNTGQSSSTSTDSDSISDSNSGDTQSNGKVNGQNGPNIKVLHHESEDEEDDSVQKMYMNSNRSAGGSSRGVGPVGGGHQYSLTMQPPPHPQYNYIHPQHAASMQIYQGIHPINDFTTS